MIPLAKIFFAIVLGASMFACGSHPKDKERLTWEDDDSGGGGGSGGDSSKEPKPTSDKDTRPILKGCENTAPDPALCGTWQSDCFISNGGNGLPTVVTHKFGDKKTSTTLVQFEDKCPDGTPMIRVELHSTYAAGKESALGQKVKLVDYTMERAFLTPLTRGEVFQSQRGRRCGLKDEWEIGEPVEISALTEDQRNECGRNGAPAPGDQLFDIYKIEAGKLRFGTGVHIGNTESVGDAPDNRPDELEDLAYERVVE